MAGELCHSEKKNHYPLFWFTRKSGGDNIVRMCDCRHGESNHCVDLLLQTYKTDPFLAADMPEQRVFLRILLAQPMP